MLLINCIIWIGFTHLQSRFFVLAIPIGALLIARIEWGDWWPAIGRSACRNGRDRRHKLTSERLMDYLDKNRQVAAVHYTVGPLGREKSGTVFILT